MKKNYFTVQNKVFFVLIIAALFSQQCVNAQEYVTVEASGYNEDVIANGVGTMNSSITNIVDSDSFCLLSEDWKLNAGDPDITVGLPENGVIPSQDIAGLSYQIGSPAAPYSDNNSLRLDNIGGGDERTLTLATPAIYTNLYFLALSGNGSANTTMTVNFDDNSSQSIENNVVPDWFGTGLPIEISGIGRGDVTLNNVETPADNPKLFRLEALIAPENITKPITSVTFTKIDQADQSVLNVLAFSGLTTDPALSINDSALASISVFPNPIKNLVTVSASQIIEELTLYNLLGQELFRLQPTTKNTTINTENLTIGNYILKAIINGDVSTYKILKD
ncbi:MAG: T9SS type A sorting domain-containing protein [Patiriisocius sp.]|uniref:T9SS type A sorting domain-containing protein n=1 Tax=Patiriisocius sp. TaxID=2822396 RepID=UPI003EF9EDC2